MRWTPVKEKENYKWPETEEQLSSSGTLVLGGEEGQPGTHVCCPLHTSQYNPKTKKKQTKQNLFIVVTGSGFKIL